MMNLLIILVVILSVIAIAQLTKVYALTHSIRKSREEEITHADNKLNANLMLVWGVVFFTGTIVLYTVYGHYLPRPASEHGVPYDNLMMINIWMITVMFFITNGALFYLAWKYYYRKERKARFFVHDHRLEMAWTLIPGIIMAFIIVYGLIIWNNMTGPASADSMKVEVFSKQFDWTVRYSGKDGQFGSANFNIIDDAAQNPIGIVTKETVQAKLDTLEAQINGLKASLAGNEESHLFPDSKVEAIEDQIYRLQRHKQRIMEIDEHLVGGVNSWEAGKDDQVVKGEMHLVKGREVELIFNSRDVIHSAFMPHFRAQMNNVPGMATRFKMTPTITTREMREELGDPEFDYLLLCNKVCGAAHFNMKMKIVVEEQADFDAWIAKQKTFVASEMPAEPAAAPADTTAATPPAAAPMAAGTSMK